MSENRVDPTVAGLFLVAFITLVFGFAGLEAGLSLDNIGLFGIAGSVALVVGLVFVVLTVSAIRCGNAFAASLFGFVAVALMVPAQGLGMLPGFASPMLFILLGILFIVFALVAFLIGAPKLLAILLILVALLYVFVGVTLMGEDTATVFGLFGVLAGVVALYMAFALSTQKLPVF